jgi:MATE family multidrug resistance protein
MHVPPAKPRYAQLSVSEGLRKLGVFSLPIICTALIQVLTQLITLGYIGRLDSAEYMGAVTLGNMVCNVTGYSLIFGLSTALDTLISQAYGAKMYSLMGLHAQRAIVILSLFTIPVVVMWTYTGEFLYYVLSIEYDTSMLAGQWARYIRYGIWPALVFDILRKFLYGQQVVWPVVVSSLCGLIVNFALNAVYHRTHFISVVAGDGGKLAVELQPGGFLMAGMSFVISQWAALLILIALILVRKGVLRKKYANASPVYVPLTQEESGGNGTASAGANANASAAGSSVLPDADDFYDVTTETNWPPISRSVLKDWKPFLDLGIPGAFSLFFEWGSFETVAGIAGQLGAIGLATHGIFMSTAALFYQFPAAISQATAILAGNYLGNNDADGCKFIVRLGLWVDFCWGVFAGSVLVLFMRPHWAYLYTNVKEVQDMIYTTLPILWLYMTVDSTKCITLNILRSTGRPGITVVGNVVACLCVMLPGGYWLALKLRYGLIGLWLAMSLAWFVVTCAYFYIVVSTGWQSQADEAHSRNVHAAEEDARHARSEGDACPNNQPLNKPDISDILSVEVELSGI